VNRYVDEWEGDGKGNEGNGRVREGRRRGDCEMWRWADAERGGQGRVGWKKGDVEKIESKEDYCRTGGKADAEGDRDTFLRPYHYGPA